MKIKSSIILLFVAAALLVIILGCSVPDTSKEADQNTKADEGTNTKSNSDVNANAEAPAENPAKDENSANVELTNETTVEKAAESPAASEAKLSSEILANFSFKPTCNLGYHLFNIYVKFSQVPLDYSLQLRKSSEAKFTNISSYRGEEEKNIQVYVCTNCPVGDNIKIDSGEDYFARLKVNMFGNVAYSDELFFSTKNDSEVMTKICSAADDPKCYDTEDTKNSQTRGRVTLRGVDYTEQCASISSAEEYWCENGAVQKEIVECGVKCFQGRCIN